MVIFSDGDLITLFDSSDLSFAIQCSRILKITLFGRNPAFLGVLSWSFILICVVKRFGFIMYILCS